MTFEEIYAKQYSKVRAFCLSRVRNVEDAEDIAQSSFAMLYKHWNKYQHNQQNECKGLLIQMAKWLVIAHRRNQNRTVSVDEIAPLTVHHKFPESSKRLLDKVWELPRLQRRALIMYYWADMTYEEIAAAMGTGFTTAHYRTQAGVKRLRKELIR